jgi:hypothetical protein
MPCSSSKITGTLVEGRASTGVCSVTAPSFTRNSPPLSRPIQRLPSRLSYRTSTASGPTPAGSGTCVIRPSRRCDTPSEVVPIQTPPEEPRATERTEGSRSPSSRP